MNNSTMTFSTSGQDYLFCNMSKIWKLHRYFKDFVFSVEGGLRWRFLLLYKQMIGIHIYRCIITSQFAISNFMFFFRVAFNIQDFILLFVFVSYKHLRLVSEISYFRDIFANVALLLAFGSIWYKTSFYQCKNIVKKHISMLLYFYYNSSC